MLIDGDQVMAVIADHWRTSGQLKMGGVVATVMSNMGLERYLVVFGLTLERTKVGDRYVVEHMRRDGFNVGGEQSGHIILSDYTTTGDGLDRGPAGSGRRSRLRPTGRARSAGCSSRCRRCCDNVRFNGGQPLEQPALSRPSRMAKPASGNSGPAADPQVRDRTGHPGDGRR